MGFFSRKSVTVVVLIGALVSGCKTLQKDINDISRHLPKSSKRAVQIDSVFPFRELERIKRELSAEGVEEIDYDSYAFWGKYVRYLHKELKGIDSKLSRVDKLQKRAETANPKNKVYYLEVSVSQLKKSIDLLRAIEAHINKSKEKAKGRKGFSLAGGRITISSMIEQVRKAIWDIRNVAAMRLVAAQSALANVVRAGK